MLSPNLMKSQIPYTVGASTTNFWCWFQICWNPKFPKWRGAGVCHQLLMLSPNLLKSQIPYTVGGTTNFWCWVQICWNPKFPMWWGRVHHQLLILSPNLLKSQIPYMVGGGGVLPRTSDAEPKLAEIPNSLYGGRVEVRGDGLPFFTFWCWHLLRICSELKKFDKNFIHPVSECITYGLLAETNDFGQYAKVTMWNSLSVYFYNVDSFWTNINKYLEEIENVILFKHAFKKSNDKVFVIIVLLVLLAFLIVHQLCSNSASRNRPINPINIIQKANSSMFWVVNVIQLLNQITKED